MSDRLEEELEKMQARRNAIWNDLKTHALALSPASQVALIGEIASIDIHIKDMKRELENMGWMEFMSDLWNEEGKK